MDTKRMKEIEKARYFFHDMPDSNLKQDWDFLIQTIKHQQVKIDYYEGELRDISTEDDWGSVDNIQSYANKVLEESE